MDPREPAMDFEGSREIQKDFDSDENVQEMKVMFQWHLSIVGWDGWETEESARTYFDE